MQNKTAFLRRCMSMIMLTAALSSAVSAATDPTCNDSLLASERSMARLATDRIDSVFESVAASVRALGNTYARWMVKQDAPSETDKQRWIERRSLQGGTAGFRSGSAELETPPAFQAPYPGFYSYGGETLSDAVARELDLFERLAPTFRTVYESFPFSWVYMTTVHDAMLIYPYLPIDEAVNNATPTDTPFYKAANFEERAVGWTSPYLDLVGAGMMITASYPVYEGDKLLGVMSRDITLKQLANSVLSRLTEGNGQALIVDRRGLAIDATDSALADEIDRVNSNAKAAVLYLRTAEGLASVSDKNAVASSSAPLNALVEQILAKVGSGTEVVHDDLDGQHVLAAKIQQTDWLLIMLRPSSASALRYQ